MAKPLVSIVIPVFNGARYLQEAIESALNQTWPETEILVINDGSTDCGATDRIARSYGDQIRYFLKENGGVGSALNLGLRKMRGSIFCWLSHDDRFLPQKIEQQVTSWKRLGKPDALLFSDYRLIDAAGQTISEVRMDRAMLAAKPLYALLRGCVNGCSVFIPKRLIKQIGGFDESLAATQDYDCWWRLIARVPFLHLPRVLLETRVHDEQGSRSSRALDEGNRFWAEKTAAIERPVQESLEGSGVRFGVAMATFLQESGYEGAAATIRARSARLVDDTLVSVVIPVHNRFDLAISAVESAAAQTHHALEILVIEDGSTEDPRAFEAAMARLAPRARLIRHGKRGSSAARNAGWSAARGHYVAFLDADDLWLPDKVAGQLRAMEEAGAAFGHTSYFRHWPGERNLEHIDVGREGDESDLIASCRIATPTVMVRRALWDEGFCFPESCHLGADVVLWLRLAARFGTFHHPRADTVVRSSSASSFHDRAKLREGLANILAAVRSDSVLKHHQAEIDLLIQSYQTITSDGGRRA